MMVFVQNSFVILARMTEIWNALHSGNLEYAFVLMGLRRNSRMTRILGVILESQTKATLLQSLTKISRFTENPSLPTGERATFWLALSSSVEGFLLSP